MKAISYGPVPLKAAGPVIAQDDWMVEAAKPMWGPRGRDATWQCFLFWCGEVALEMFGVGQSEVISR